MTELVGVEIVTARDGDGQEHELLRVAGRAWEGGTGA